MDNTLKRLICTGFRKEYEKTIDIATINNRQYWVEYASFLEEKLIEEREMAKTSDESAALPLHGVNASTSIECTDGEHHFYEVYFVNSDKEPFELDCIKCLECGKIDTDI